ncbi:MAG: hypothetical protein GC203_19770 [Phenylobacterium sp.]|uniref:hypothetical protein n=1 Tax=Phenylobacterium sp. TaxID=1871053 RepID=UPI0025EC1658|nr:hypothetical protein [Phenylobacterium sp.]MBI1200104.1 hypothetical protein [Phenylobacterium sp.]
MRLLFAAGLIGLSFAPAAQAQTAADINRLNAAIQICSSPVAASTPECARLHGRLGMSAAPGIGGAGGGLGGGLGGGAVATGLGGLLGAALSSRNAAPSAPPAAPPPASGPGVSANGQIMIGGAPLGGAPRGAPAASGPALRGPDAANGVYAAGQSYQACVAADQANWRRCLPLLNGGQPR